MIYQARCIEEEDCGYTTWTRDDTQTLLCAQCDRVMLFFDPYFYLEENKNDSDDSNELDEDDYTEED